MNKINILDLPPDIFSAILGWLELDTGIDFLKSLHLDIEYAFRYCQFYRSEYIKATSTKLRESLGNSPRYFNALLLNQHFRSSVACVEAFMIAAHCGFVEAAERILAHPQAFSASHGVRECVLSDAERNVLSVSIPRAIAAIATVFSENTP